MEVHKRFHVAPIHDVPEERTLSPDVVFALKRATLMLPQIPSTNLDNWRDLHNSSQDRIFSGELEKFKNCFDDPLTVAYREYHLGVAGPRKSKTDTEISFFPKMLSIVDGIDAQKSVRYLIPLLEDVSSSVLGRKSSIRAKPIFIAKDWYGRSVQFPDHHSIRPQLQLICDLLVYSKASTVYKAVACYILLVGAHPFLDGNGRVSRMLFNAILVSGGLHPSAYIPLKEILDITQGSLAIRTRRVLMRGDWVPIFEGLSSAIMFASTVNRLASNGAGYR